jgi:tetratricopeptide (TPR) repeat protein
LPLALALVFTVWLVATRDSSTREALWGPSLGAHLGTVLRVHAHYLRQLVVPLQLIADYSPEAFPPSSSLFELPALGAAALVLGLCGLAGLLLLRGRRPLLGGTVAVYFVLLLPASQIVIHHELLAEHRLYLPSLCFAALIAAGLLALWRGARRRLLVGLLGGIYGASLMLLTMDRVLDWVDPLILWRTTVTQVPRCARARANLGALLARRKQFGPARRHLERALEIRPDLCAARLNLGKLEIETGHGEQGLRQLQGAVRCKPSSPSFRHELARASLALGRYREAGELFDALLAAAPDDAELHYGAALPHGPAARRAVSGRRGARGARRLPRPLAGRPSGDASRPGGARGPGEMPPLMTGV